MAGGVHALAVAIALAGGRGRIMTETLFGLAEWTGRALEIAGIFIIVGGVLLSTAELVSRAVEQRSFAGTYHRYRTSVARGILLGLEFLVAADIVGTVSVEASFQNLGVLALIVVIRTFLSFSLEVEINGRWPWQAGPGATHERGGGASEHL